MSFQFGFSTNNYIHKLSLMLKFIIPAVLTIALILTGLTFITALGIQDLEEDQARLAAKNSMMTLRSSLKFSMMEGISEFNPLIEELSQMEGLSSVRLIPSAKLEIETAMKPDAWEEQILGTGNEKSGFVDTEEGRAYRIVLPIVASEGCLDCHDVNQNDILASISANVSTVEWDNSRRALVFEIILTSLAALVILGLIIFFTMKFTVIKPLNLAVDFSKKIAEGDFTENINIKENR